MRQVPALSRGNLSRRLSALAAVLVTLASTGCGSGSPTITSLPPQPRPKPPTGTVMLQVTAAPSAGVQQPGFVARDTRPCQRKVGGECYDRIVATSAPALPTNTTGSILAAGVIGLSFAPPVGAVIGVPLAIGLAGHIVSARESTRAVLLAFADIPVAERFVDAMLVAGRAYRVVPPAGTGTNTATPDTVLELDGPRISLVSDDITYVSPDLQLRVTVAARLVRASDRERLERWWWSYEGPTARLADWGENDAQLFRTELQHALRTIAARAIEQVAPDPVQTPATEPKG